MNELIYTFDIVFYIGVWEEGMTTHSSTLAWRIPWTEEPGGLQSLWLQRVGQDERLSTHTHARGLDAPT